MSFLAEGTKASWQKKQKNLNEYKIEDVKVY